MLHFQAQRCFAAERSGPNQPSRVGEHSFTFRPRATQEVTLRRNLGSWGDDKSWKTLKWILLPVLAEVTFVRGAVRERVRPRAVVHAVVEFSFVRRPTRKPEGPPPAHLREGHSDHTWLYVHRESAGGARTFKTYFVLVPLSRVLDPIG